MLRFGILGWSLLVLTNAAASVSVHVDIKPPSSTTVAAYTESLVTTIFQNGVSPDSNYAGCEDAWMFTHNPDDNYGTNTWGDGMGYYTGVKRSLIRFDVSDISSQATVSSAVLRLHMSKVEAERTLEAYQVLLPWTRLGTTWNSYDGGNAWGTSGCGGSGTDRASTSAASLTVPTAAADSWIEISLPASLVQGWVDGTISNNGVLLKVTDETSGEMRFSPENDSTAANRPQLVIEHSSAGGGDNTIAPAAVTDLAVSNSGETSVTLTWTAPGDDLGTGGAVTSYDLRYSTDPIDTSSWSLATPVTTGTPSQPGQTDTVTVTELSPGTTYYFALTSDDSAGNVSDLSDVLQVTTAAPDLTPPAAVDDLAAIGVGSNALTLTWTATGDDDNSGTAAAYDIRYSASLITDEATFAAAQPVEGAPVPFAAGTTQNLLVSESDADYNLLLRNGSDRRCWQCFSSVERNYVDDVAARYDAAGGS